MIKIECDELNEVQVVMNFFRDYELVNVGIEDFEEVNPIFNKKYIKTKFYLDFEEKEEE